MNNFSQGNEAHRKVKRSERREKRRYLVKEAEKAAKRKEISTLYRITRSLSGQNHTSSGPIRDKEGKLLTTDQEKDKRWNISKRSSTDKTQSHQQTLENVIGSWR
jgi:hypothetical protein